MMTKMDLQYLTREINEAGTPEHDLWTCVLSKAAHDAIYCTDWSERLENEEKFKDELKISIWSEAFSKFLEYEAY